MTKLIVPPVLEIIRDTAEQKPLTFSPRALVVNESLDIGDYSARGLVGKVGYERKTLDDLVNSLIHDRERFFNELREAQKFELFEIIVEADIKQLFDGRMHSNAKPESIIAAISQLKFEMKISTHFLGCRPAASLWIEDGLWRSLVARSKKRKLKAKA